MTELDPKPSLLDRIKALIPEEYREAGYRLVATVVTLLFGLGILTSGEAELWTQLGVSTVTLLFAALYATSQLRLALYLLLGPGGAVLMYYGLISDVRWAVITAAVGQIFGLTTAAAKTVQAPKTAPPLAA